MTNDKARPTICPGNPDPRLGQSAPFPPGTNLMAWLYTILRNELYSTMRRRRREVEDTEGIHAARLAVQPTSTAPSMSAISRWLLPSYRTISGKPSSLSGPNALLRGSGADLQGSRGNRESRVNRARGRLAQLLQVSDDEDFDPMAHTNAALQQARRRGSS